MHSGFSVLPGSRIYFLRLPSRNPVIIFSEINITATEIMHRFRTILIGCLLVFGLAIGALHARDRGVARVIIQDKQGQQVGLYRESHALVIGVSGYDNGWPKLPGARQDIEAVARALTDNGFHVETVLDPASDQLQQAFEKFIRRHGRKPENRLLFYFAGHGHTVTPKWGGDPMGYIVPRDAPNPSQDEVGFKDLALPMQRIQEYALGIDAKHALFLFDSCFSGSLFAINRAVSEHISAKTAKPVRQFITAGTDQETVPDKSIFRRQFVAALAGEGDVNEDGYLTGAELGEFLQEKVVNYSRGSQHPQYGKIRNPHLDKGDFVFVLEKEPPLRVAGGPPSADPAMEREFWHTVQSKDSVAMYRAYLERYPSGHFAPLAEIRIEELMGSQAGNQRPSSRQGMPGPSAKDGNTPMPGPSARDGKNQPTTARLIVRSNVSGDKVTIDGKAMGATGPKPHTLPPGEHEIRVEKEGFKAFEAKIHLVAGGEETIRARLEREVPSHGQGFRDRLRDGSLGPEMISIPDGCFQMGSPDSEKDRDSDERRHRVCVEGFALGKTEVTFAEYDRFARATGRKQPDDEGWGRGKRPVINVRWKDATAYAEWLSGQTGKQYRLPTEAEWEYAARAGTTTPFSTGECISTSQANYDGDYDYANCGAKGVFRRKTVPAGSLPANPWGLHEIHGNVWEWTCSLFKENYDGSEKHCTSKGDDGGRALRGGSWYFEPRRLRSAYRFMFNPNEADNLIGFRLARDF
uniref:Formylglycine-generating enzyme, required for sulfatase activity, contains SUMF1/FGE domain n=1 Tax=Candidatus Kentrum sp. FW TaxID=2126338 RepID=A0A450SAS6_9GAMM|nr:MAG: Formylglycine-generating enzyme, required for sulfatase activity, contains SUMF1/FGE domain [Candidatus Kentron sp. FW]